MRSLEVLLASAFPRLYEHAPMFTPRFGLRGNPSSARILTRSSSPRCRHLFILNHISGSHLTVSDLRLIEGSAQVSLLVAPVTPSFFETQPQIDVFAFQYDQYHRDF
jgi:hypothetical protein